MKKYGNEKKIRLKILATFFFSQIFVWYWILKGSFKQTQLFFKDFFKGCDDLNFKYKRNTTWCQKWIFNLNVVCNKYSYSYPKFEQKYFCFQGFLWKVVTEFQTYWNLIDCPCLLSGRTYSNILLWSKSFFLKKKPKISGLLYRSLN